MRSGKWRVSLLLLLSVVTGAWVGGGAWQSRHPVALNGHDWSRMSPEARSAYLSGFIAGAAAQQAGGGKGAPERVALEAARLRRASALHFPLRENVYRSHLDDYFFYQNRRDQTLIQAIVEVSRQMRAQK